jgi:hypothetical protein
MSGEAIDLFDEPQLDGSHFERSIMAIATGLAERAGPEGITAADVRLAAGRRGLLPPHPGTQRAWSFLAPLFRQMVKAELVVATGRFRRSPIPKSHGNAHQIYVARTFWHEAL